MVDNREFKMEDHQPKRVIVDTSVLERVLRTARGHLSKVEELLRVLPLESQERQELLERWDQLMATVEQVQKQIAVAMGAK